MSMAAPNEGFPEARKNPAKRNRTGRYSGTSIVAKLVDGEFLPIVEGDTITWQDKGILWLSRPSRVVKGTPLLYGAIRQQNEQRRLFEWDTWKMPLRRGRAEVLHIIELGNQTKEPMIRSNFAVYNNIDLSNMLQVEEVVESLEEVQWTNNPEALNIPDLSRRIVDAFTAETPKEFGVHEPKTTKSIRNRSQI